MLFLLNNRVHDVRDIDGAVACLPPAPGGRRWIRARVGDVLDFVRSAFLVSQNNTIGEDQARALAALIAVKTEANAALVVVPPGATHYGDVQIRLANVSLPVLGGLLLRQQEKALPAKLVNQQVWKAVA